MDFTINEDQVGQVLIFIICLLGVGPFILPFILALFQGGRMGSLKTSRSEDFAGSSMEELWDTFAGRLSYEDFKVESSGRPQTILAHRHDRQLRIPRFEMHTHAGRPLKCRVDFQPLDDGIRATLTLQYDEFIIVDTGEGQYRDLLMDRLMTADLAHDARPIVANPNFHIRYAYWISGAMVAAAFLPLLPGFNASRTLGLFVGLILATVSCVVLSLIGSLMILLKPREISGLRTIPKVLLLSFCGLALTAGIGYARYGSVIVSHLQKSRAKARAAALSPQGTAESSPTQPIVIR